jgi:AraC-like DNA-binding protein/mannose-6-phosphate isomerase-like protein (cupin superfamily)
MLLRHNMSVMRQPAVLTEFDPRGDVSIASLAYQYSAGFNVPEHAHGSDQLIFAISGLMEVSSGQSAWLIPPQFALWIPARTLHRIHMLGAVSMRTLYLRPRVAARTEPGTAVVHVTPLLRELIEETVRVGQLRSKNRYQCALRDMLIAQLERASPMPTFVTLPREDRALAVAQAILRKPSDSRPMAALCAASGVSVRTIQRTFRKEVGIDFESWRRQVRLIRAIELLISGRTVKQTAAEIGYSQPSAFVEMFRRTFGTTPKAWVSALRTP